ncbi:MAG: hypothetical protein FWF01_04570, partial [Alphaproteobacteria bacterium]|nr:hypothetical protein [Alphaproteobacteria bacterium]
MKKLLAAASLLLALLQPAAAVASVSLETSAGVDFTRMVFSFDQPTTYNVSPVSGNSFNIRFSRPFTASMAAMRDINAVVADYKLSDNMMVLGIKLTGHYRVRHNVVGTALVVDILGVNPLLAPVRA